VGWTGIGRGPKEDSAELGGVWNTGNYCQEITGEGLE